MLLYHNLVPMASVVELEVEGPPKAGCHMTKFSNIVGKFSLHLLGYLIFVINFPNICIGKFGHVTTSLCPGLCLPHASLYKEALGTRLVIPFYV